MNLKSYLILFTIAVSAILLLNSGAVTQVKADKIYKYDGHNFVNVIGITFTDKIAVGNKDNVWAIGER